MSKVKLGTILENAARLAGRCVSPVGLPEDWKAIGALAIGEGIRRIAAEKFPLMQRVEFRRYRPTWTSNDGWTRGMECWHGEDYWRLMTDVSTGAPSEGGGWKKLEMKDLVAFIEFDQPWENTSIDRCSVDVNRFAYVEDPKLHPNATPLHVVALNEMGIVIESPAPAGVWCRFVPSYPNVSFVDWSAAAAYSAGEVVYLGETRDCYQCIADVAAPVDGGAPNQRPDADWQHWEPVRISSEFENFLTRLVAADFLTSDQGKFQTKAAADREFEILCERYHEGNGESSVRRGRFR